jgi:hypothetical protein
MWKTLCPLVLAFVLSSAVSVVTSAQTPVPSAEATGVVARVDERHNVVILNDGRMLRATPATVILANGQSATISSLIPGTMVVIRSAQPVVISGGQYVALTDSPAASVPAGAIRTRTFGKVKDVDRDGDVKIETQSGTLRVKVSPDAARMLKDGDTAVVDVTITTPAPTVR